MSKKLYLNISVIFFLGLVMVFGVRTANAAVTYERTSDIYTPVLITISSDNACADLPQFCYSSSGHSFKIAAVEKSPGENIWFSECASQGPPNYQPDLPYGPGYFSINAPDGSTIQSIDLALCYDNSLGSNLETADLTLELPPAEPEPSDCGNGICESDYFDPVESCDSCSDDCCRWLDESDLDPQTIVDDSLNSVSPTIKYGVGAVLVISLGVWVIFLIAGKLKKHVK